MISHANRGKGWELVLDQLHQLWMRGGHAYIQRNNPPVKFLKSVRGTRSGQFVGCYEADGPPDYLIQVRGISILLDAKECAAERWDLKNLKHHQALAFTRFERHAGFAGVLMRYQNRRTIILPWRLLGPLWNAWNDATRVGRAAPGSASLSLEQMAYVAAFNSPDSNYLESLIQYISRNP